MCVNRELYKLNVNKTTTYSFMLFQRAFAICLAGHCRVGVAEMLTSVKQHYYLVNTKFSVAGEVIVIFLKKLFFIAN